MLYFGRRRNRPDWDDVAVDLGLLCASGHARRSPWRIAPLSDPHKTSGQDLALQQSIKVLREGQMVPDRITRAKTDKPAEQKVELQSLHQLALGANTAKRLQQHRPKQLLRCNRWSTKARIERSKFPRQIVQRRFRYLPDRPQRMVAPNPGLLNPRS